jgi:protein MAK11
MSYLPISDPSGKQLRLLAVSTEDGRILFYDTDNYPSSTNGDTKDELSIPDATLHVQLGGKAAGISNRVKDFEILFLPANSLGNKDLLIVAAGSDGTIRLFHIAILDLLEAVKSRKSPQLGKLIGLYETGNRITCLKAFVMLPSRNVEGDPGEENDEFEGFDGESGESESDSDDE